MQTYDLNNQVQIVITAIALLARKLWILLEPAGFQTSKKLTILLGLTAKGNTSLLLFSVN